MNYLAHLLLAKADRQSLVGNLMGDFTKGVDIAALPAPIQRGIANHRLVDRVTDHHPAVQALRPHYSDKRRRFAGIIGDLAFDHLLIRHWSRFSDEPFNRFIDFAYHNLQQSYGEMPERMVYAVEKMVEQDWLRNYRDLDGLGAILDRIARRIRFDNALPGGVIEIRNNYDRFEAAFLTLFPTLQQRVREAAIEVSGEPERSRLTTNV